MIETKRGEMSRAVGIEQVASLPDKTLHDFVGKMQHYSSTINNTEAIDKYITEGSQAVSSCSSSIRFLILYFINLSFIISRAHSPQNRELLYVIKVSEND